jgi:2'-hydroxyisoflavone reductase
MLREMLREVTGMRVLVAGGTRFIGRHLVEFLLDEGHAVTLFNRGQTNPDLFPEAARIRGDRADPPAALGQRDWDWVFDVSAYVEDELTPLVRVVGPRTGRYIYVCTGGSYMQSPDGAEITEDSPQWPAEERYLGAGAPNAYGAKKAKAERALWRMAPEYGMEVSVVRPVVVYGPWDPTDRCHYWLHRVQVGTVVVPEEPASFTRCVYVKDLVRELVAAAKAPHAKNRAYNAAQTRHRTLQEWIDTAAAVLGTTPRVKRVSWEALKEAGVGGLPAVSRGAGRNFSTQRAQQELGLTSTPFAQTLAECFAHMQAEGRPIAEGIPTHVLARLMG